MTSQRQFVLGLLFVAALAILGYYTLFLTDFRLFKEVHELTVSFPEASGLRKGDPVLVAGIRAGKVRSLAFDPRAPLEQRVTVSLSLDQDVPLREGHTIVIAAATLLGGHNVIIDPGPAEGAPVSAEAPLQGAISVDALAGLSDLVADNRSKIDAILSNLESASGEFEELLSDVRGGGGFVGQLLFDEDLASRASAAISDASRTFNNLSTLSNDVLAGRGVIGKLFTDEDLVVAAERIAQNLNAISGELRTITEDVRGGRGTIGRLLRDDEIGSDVAGAMENLRGIVAKINAGEGTLGRLVVDDTLGESVTSIAQRLAAGEGALGKLLQEDRVYDNLERASSDLAVILETVREGRGTVGKLLTDDTLYEDLQRALGTVNRSLEEYREVAPITSFTNILFGAF